MQKRCFLYVFLFFQAEDGIRSGRVTGVQTCALPICPSRAPSKTQREPESMEGSVDGEEGGSQRCVASIRATRSWTCARVATALDSSRRSPGDRKSVV